MIRRTLRRLWSRLASRRLSKSMRLAAEWDLSAAEHQNFVQMDINRLTILRRKLEEAIDLVTERLDEWEAIKTRHVHVVMALQQEIEIYKEVAIPLLEKYGKVGLQKMEALVAVLERQKVLTIAGREEPYRGET